MTPEIRERWEREIRKQKEPFNKPADLFRRAVSSEDFVDSAILGGVSVADILAGKIAEAQIPHDVINAFHAQFPQHGSSFVDAVNHLAHDPDRLMGLVSGVKGKLFEIDYAAWLNHGHLPAGFTAELAEHANNPGWDIAVRDGHGHIDHLLQLKATDHLDYVREALAAHPDIDVVIPHELYDKIVDQHDLVAHIIDGHEPLQHINGQVADAVGHAEAAGAAEHVPIMGPLIVICLAAALNFQSYRKGRITPAEALRNVGERGALAGFAAGAGWAAVLIAHEPFVGLPVSVVSRLLGGQFLHNRHRRELLEGLIGNAKQSRGALELQVQRPLLEASIR